MSKITSRLIKLSHPNPQITPELQEFIQFIYNKLQQDKEDQLVVLLGISASGKSLTFKNILNILSFNANNPLHLTKGIRDADAILSAFGHACSSDSHFDSSKYGKYFEFQYSHDGIMSGCKILQFNLQQSIVHSNATHHEGQNFHIFYHLIAGATPKEKAAWQLSDPHSFNYLGRDRIKTPSKGLKTGSSIIFGALRKHLKSIGCGPRMQDGIFQLMAGILHLGDILFVTDNMQEHASVKNASKLHIVSELFNCKPDDLEFVLTSKSTMAGNEKCTMLLDGIESLRQRDKLASFLYALVFSWLVEQINARYSLDEESIYNYISVLDFPGMSANKKYAFGYNQLVVNFMDERISLFAKRQLCEKSIDSFYDQKLPELVRDIKSLPDQANLIELLGNPTRGLLLKLSTYRISFKELTNIAKQNECLLPDKKKSCAIFSIRHSIGIIDYKIDDVTSNPDSYVCADFVSLFCQSARESTDNTTFIRQLFSKNFIAVEFDPVSPSTIVKANCSYAPNRRPSVKAKTNSTNPTGFTADLLNNHPMSQMLSSFENLLHTSEDISTHLIYHEFNSGNFAKTNDNLVVRRDLFGEFGLEALQKSATSPFCAELVHSEFLYRYSEKNSRVPIFNTSQAECLKVINSLGWEENMAIVGTSKVFLNQVAWEYLSMPSPNSNIENSQLEEDLSNHLKMELESKKSDSDEEEDCDDLALRPGLDARDKAAIRNSDIELGFSKDNKKVFDTIKPAVRTSWKYPKEMSLIRKCWISCTWGLTWWIPIPLVSLFKKRNADTLLAFREKVALCIIILLMSLLMLFVIILLGPLICPKQNIRSANEIASSSTLQNPSVIVYGNMYKIPDVVQTHVYGGQYITTASTFQATVLGQDVSAMFFPMDYQSLYCPGFNFPKNWDNFVDRYSTNSAAYVWFPHRSNSSDYLSTIRYMKTASVARDRSWISNYIKSQSETNKVIVAWDRVYDISSYYLPANILANSSGFMGPNVKQIFDQYSSLGKDATFGFNQLKSPAFGGPAFFNQVKTCMDGLFLTGVVDHRQDFACQISNYTLLITAAIMFGIIAIKFIASLQFGSPRTPEDQDKFVICLISCFTEGHDSILKTINSIATSDYDSQRKLLLIVCDGMVIGHGNDRPTPRIVLDILGVKSNVDPEPVVFQSVGKGSKQFNMAKVYSGLYKVDGHQVPFLVITKIGQPSERKQPGNRGKRDSQLLLMRFLNRVHFQLEMNPLEITMYNHLKESIGIHPFYYEYILMVDADTAIYPDSIKRLVSTMVNDSRISGVCGETKISNEKHSWVTMIQVYEYFLTHYMSKAFESLFGSVTCLTGCFSMFRIRNPAKNKPVFVSDAMIASFSDNNQQTLHAKNLLELGEDRYLTTLLLKHFPFMKTSFNIEAKCLTTAPDRLPILLSQRRRWTNSTVHNLLELVFIRQLCGFCLFGMRFIVIIDLFATLLQPAILLYVIYVLYSAIMNPTSFYAMISLALIFSVYGLQIILFMIQQEWQYIGWMLLYLLSSPLFNVFIPIYSFWKFDNFTWGYTKRAIKDKNLIPHLDDTENNKFDISEIPMKPYPDIENEEAPVFQDKIIEVLKERKLNSAEMSGASYFTPASSMYKNQQNSADVSVASFNPAVAIPMMYQPMYQPISAVQAMNIPPAEIIVTDDLLVLEIRRILDYSDLSKLTKKQVRSSLDTIFQTDLGSRKAFINMQIDKILSEEI